MFNFAKNIVRDFKNIYVEEDKIREAYGNEYADRYSNKDPKTGKKMISGPKIFVRIFIVFIVILCLFFMVRIMTNGSDVPFF
jgi:hypothetical protein